MALSPGTVAGPGLWLDRGHHVNIQKIKLHTVNKRGSGAKLGFLGNLGLFSFASSMLHSFKSIDFDCGKAI